MSEGSSVAMPCFSSLAELRPVLEEGISVTFSDKRDIEFINLLNCIRKYKDCPRFRIRIGTAKDHFPNKTSGMTANDLLEEQKTTLIHELTHAFHHCAFGQNLGLLHGAFGLGKREYEKAIDEGALRIVRQNDGFFDAVILELSLHQKCWWKYEVADTPFRHFHRGLISSGLLSQAGRLQFGNLQQIKLLQLFREMQA